MTEKSKAEYYQLFTGFEFPPQSYVLDAPSVASKRPGFISGETLVNIDDPSIVIVISTWRTAEDWKAWDESAERATTKPSIQALLVQPFDSFIHPIGAWREDLINTF